MQTLTFNFTQKCFTLIALTLSVSSLAASQTVNKNNFFKAFKQKACTEMNGYDAIFQKYAVQVTFEPLYKGIEKSSSLSDACPKKETYATMQKLNEELKAQCLHRAQLPKIYQNREVMVLSCEQVANKVELLKSVYSELPTLCEKTETPPEGDSPTSATR